MTCPKCEEGTIKKVIIKMTGEEASLCDYCETLWLMGEEIKYNTGHPFDVVKQGEALEYTLEESEDEDQEHRSTKYTHAK